MLLIKNYGCSLMGRVNAPYNAKFWREKALANLSPAPFRCYKQLADKIRSKSPYSSKFSPVKVFPLLYTIYTVLLHEFALMQIDCNSKRLVITKIYYWNGIGLIFTGNALMISSVWYKHIWCIVFFEIISTHFLVFSPWDEIASVVFITCPRASSSPRVQQKIIWQTV